MDPISAVILALLYAALRAPREAGRSVGRDYRGRRDRWSSRAEPWMNPRGRGPGRGRGGRRVAGYDRNGRGYTNDQRGGRRRGDPGWRTDPRAWRGREGRARVARGIRPGAIRAGIITGALAYTALFGAGVAARGFARGAAGGYRMGKAHFRAKTNQATDPTFTVDPADPGAPMDDAEIIDAEIVDEPETEPGSAGTPETTEPSDGSDPAPATPISLTPTADPDGTAAGDVRTGPWLLIVHGPGVNRWNGGDSEGIAVYDADDLDRRLALIARIPGLSADVRPLPDPFDDPSPAPASAPGTDDVDRESGAHGDEPAQPEPRDSRPDTSPAGPTTNPGGTSMSDINTELSPEQRARNRASLQALVNSFDPDRSGQAPAGIGGAAVGASISAPVLMEGANYHAHLHNLGVIGREARHEYNSAELTLTSASAARQRAEYSMAAVEQMAAGLAAQDFGEVHVGNMATLHELLARHVQHTRTAENAAQESLATSEQLIEVCMATAATFQRDHGQLAEAHASAPHAAKTREAYQPM